MAANFDAVHEDLQALRQFCIRAGKQPYIRDGERQNSFTSSGWPIHRPDWLTFSEAVQAVQKMVKVHHNGGFVKVEGIGFLVARDGQDAPQILGGDLDCCRDPATGLISPWATSLLQKIRPFYTEVSPSKCGLRYFVWGRLPGGRNSVFGNGPQDDLPAVSRERILTAKLKAREKLALGQPAFNGLELYESGRHLTITGWKIEELCFSKEDQTAAISEALEPFLVVDDAFGNGAAGGKKERERAGRGGLPHLDILDVIDTRGFTEEGSQLFGPHPTLGSTTGRNLVVNPAKGVWAYMHNGINSGGDAWLWLACECGAVAWPQAGAGALKDRAVLEQTLRHAVSRGLISETSAQAQNADGQTKPLLEICITDRHMHEITAESLPELVAYNSPPKIFVKAGCLVQIAEDENGKVRIELLSESALRGSLSRCAQYTAIFPKKNVAGNPPLMVVKDILALPRWPGILPLVGLITSPVVRPDGSIISQTGYDAATGLYYTDNTEMALNVPDTPSREDAVKAAAYIQAEVFGDFPFKDDASRANTLAALLTTLTLPLIGGNIPLGLFDKPQAGTGASLLTEIIAEMATGEKANMQTAPGNDEEWRKAITSVLAQGPQIVVIDNVASMLRSSKLSQMLTARIWSDRMLGQNKMLNLPQTAAWFATGNNLQLGGDIARRAYWVRLDAALSRPWLRDGFRHPDIMVWVKEHRSELLSMLLVMIRAWIVAGQPKGSAPRLGSFEKWSSTIGGILTFAGVASFLGNAAELYDSADQEIAQWDLFLLEWQRLHRDDLITAAQLKTELTDFQGIYKPFQNEMPEEIIKATDKTARGASVLGQALRRRADQVFPSGRKLTVTQDKHTKAMKWRVIAVGRSAEDQKAHESRACGTFAEDAEDQSIFMGILDIFVKTCKYTGNRGSSPASSANAVVDSENDLLASSANDTHIVEADAQDLAGKQHFKEVVEKHTGAKPKLNAIYYPTGEALEYANLVLNLHNGCSHQCAYCFNRFRGNLSCELRIEKSTMENIEADLKALAAVGNRDRVHLTIIGDPYDKGRQDNSVVRKVLQLLRKYDHPFQILTKGGTNAIQDFDLYGPNDRFGCTLTFDNDVDSLEWEPGGALPGDRIEALKQAHARGIFTWASLEPVIDPAQTAALIEATHAVVDHYGVGKWNHDRRANDIDWQTFRADAEALLKMYGKSYMIKAALREAAPDAPARAEPTPAKANEEPAPVDSSEQIRVSAISEFGMAGWVDPAKLSHALKLPLEEVEAWLQVNYVAYARPGGGIGYRQKRAGEAKA